MSVVDARGITKRYGDLRALSGVSLQISGGEFYGCFGPNGAGKTTLVKILTGQIEPTAGGAKVMGVEVAKDPLVVRERIGIVPEFESPPSYLTPYEFLYFVCEVRKVPNREEKIKRWLGYFDIDDDKACKDLSKGMRQKLMLAQAFIHNPKLLFLDEPFINLDPIYQEKVKKYLVDYVERGGTVFMCTHILEVADQLCSRICILDRGRVVVSKTREEWNAGGGLKKLFFDAVGEKK